MLMPARSARCGVYNKKSATVPFKERVGMGQELHHSPRLLGHDRLVLAKL
jgi:hypothetical protein